MPASPAWESRCWAGAAVWGSGSLVALKPIDQRHWKRPSVFLAHRAAPSTRFPPDRPHPAGTKSDAFKLVGPYLRMYGSGALSNSTLWNPEFIHFFVPGMGSQPYVVGRAYNRTIVIGIGDPLAHHDHWAAMALAFKRAFPVASWGHVGLEFAQILKDNIGLHINDMGAETNLLVQAWAYNKKTRTIRMAARDARTAGVAVREVLQHELTPEVCQQLAHVTGGCLGWGRCAVGPVCGGAEGGGARPLQPRLWSARSPDC
jgi:hypothetical protein